MNRMQLFKEIYEMSRHNLLCYSNDYLMRKPKAKYKEEWNREFEKLELIKELIAEENNNNFHLYTSMFKLRNNREERCHIDLAYIENRKKGISCYLTIDGFEKENKPEYMLVFTLHKVNNFDNEYENIYTRDISSKAFNSRESLKNEMQCELNKFAKFIEADKESNRFFDKYYECEENEEYE